MSFTEEDQMRIWIIAQKVMEEEALELLLNRMHILCNMYSFKCDDKNEHKQKILDLIKEIVEFITFKKDRKQEDIQELRIKINNLLSAMINTIDPRIMHEYNIWEAQT